MVCLHLSGFTAYDAIVPNSGGDLWWFAVICGDLRWFVFCHTDFTGQLSLTKIFRIIVDTTRRLTENFHNHITKVTFLHHFMSAAER